VRDGDWKLVQEKGGALELYDIAQDPSEAKDLAAENPEVVARLQGLYEAWKATHEQPRW
jgi:arylsulfatase